MHHKITNKKRTLSPIFFLLCVKIVTYLSLIMTSLDSSLSGYFVLINYGMSERSERYFLT